MEMYKTGMIMMPPSVLFVLSPVDSGQSRNSVNVIRSAYGLFFFFSPPPFARRGRRGSSIARRRDRWNGYFTIVMYQ